MKRILFIFVLAFITISTYSQGNGVLIGLSKRNAVNIESFSSKTCSYYKYNKKTKNYKFDISGKTDLEFIFTTNPLLMYIYNNGNYHADCFCEERNTSLIFDCEYDYISTMISLRNPNDFILKFYGKDLYMYYDKNFWGKYKKLVVFENIEGRKL